MKLKPCYAKLLEICTRAKYTHREAVGGGGVCGCGDSDVNGEALARLGLGFDETDIDAIAHDNVYDFEEQIHQLFRRWKESEGRDASVEKLEFALEAASLTDVKQKMSSFSEFFK